MFFYIIAACILRTATKTLLLLRKAFSITSKRFNDYPQSYHQRYITERQKKRATRLDCLLHL